MNRSTRKELDRIIADVESRIANRKKRLAKLEDTLKVLKSIK